MRASDCVVVLTIFEGSGFFPNGPGSLEGKAFANPLTSRRMALGSRKLSPLPSKISPAFWLEALPASVKRLDVERLDTGSGDAGVCPVGIALPTDGKSGILTGSAAMTGGKRGLIDMEDSSRDILLLSIKNL